MAIGNPIGKIVLLQGHVTARNENGEVRVLKLGDVVYEGEVLVTAEGAQVEIGFDDGSKYLVRAQESVTLDGAVFGTGNEDPSTSALLGRVSEATDIARAIAEGSSLDELLEETAAGLEGGGDSSHMFVSLVRIAEGLSPLDYAYNTQGSAPGTTPPSGWSNYGSSRDDEGDNGGDGTGTTPTTPGVGAQLTAGNDSVFGLEDTPINGSVAGNDRTTSGGVLTYALDRSPGHGNLVFNPDGSYSYTPDANYNGSDTFTYVVRDPVTGEALTRTVTLTVGPVDDPSILAPDTATVAEGSSATGNVLGNDSDIDNALSVSTFTVADVPGTFNAGQTVTIAGVGTLTLAANGNYTFTPSANYNGTVPQATYVTNTGSSSTLDITVTPVDDATVVTPDTQTIAEDTVATGNVLTNDSDVDNTLSVTSFTVAGVAGSFAAGSTATIAGVGSLVLNGDGTYTFTPVANYNGSVPVATYTLNTGSSSTLTITVTPVNDASVVAPDTNTVAEDSVATGNVLSNDSDIDNTLSVSSFTVAGVAGSFVAGSTATIAGVGNLVLNGDGSYSFTPVANYNGTVPVATYTLNTGSSSTLTITVTPVDDASIVSPDTNTIAEDTIATGNVLGNDSDVDSTLSVTSFTVAGVAGSFAAGSTATIAGVGSLVLNGDGTYTFTPVANYNGSVPVATYTLNTGSSSTLTITVTPVNDVSVVAPDTNTVAEDTVATGNVLGNDSDVDSTLSVTSFTVAGVAGSFAAGSTATIAGVGSLVLNGDGSYTFTPVANYNGTVPVATYTLNTGSSSTLTITVTPVDDASIVAPDTNTIAEDTVATGNVLGNDSDVDNTLSVTSFTVAGVAGSFAAGSTATIAGAGSLVLNGDGGYTFTPVADWNGSVPQVSYTLNTGSGSTLDITVTPVSDTYTDADEVVTITEDSTASGNVLTGTTSPDGTVTVSGFTVAGVPGSFAPGQTATIAGVGTLTLNSAGSYTFTPAANYNGTVPTISYTTTDGMSSDASTLTITVTPVDDAYTDADEVVSVAEDSTASGGVLTGTSSVDGAVTVVSFTVVGNPTVFTAGQTASLAGVGSLTINADGTYSFVPNANYNGTVPLVTYSTTDGSSTDSSTLAITVNPVDDASIVAPDTNTVAEDTVATGNVLGNDSDIDNTLSVSSFTVAGVAGSFAAGSTANIAGVGSLLLNSDGSYTFTPVANYNGSVPVATYTLNTGSSSTLTITVTPADDASVVAPDTNSVAEDTVATGNVLTNDSDIDNALSVTGFSIAGIPGSFAAGANVAITGVGSLTLNSDGSYSFTPATNYNGNVPQVSYTLNTGSGSTLDITVTPLDDASVVAPDTNTVAEDTVATGNVLGNDSDVDNTLSVTSFTVAGIAGSFAAGATATIAGVGDVVINSDGSYAFTPVANYNGTVPVATYTLNTGSSSTLAITVTPVDDASVLAPDTNTVAEDTVATGNVLGNDSDVDNTLTVTGFTVAGLPGSFAPGATATITNVGSLVLNADGSYTFTPAADYNGTVPQVSYAVSTGGGSTLNITVTPVTDGYADANETVSVAEDTSANGNVLTGTSSPDGAVNVTGFSIAGDPTVYTAGQTAVISGVGSLTLNGNGSYSFVPNANYNGIVPVVSYSTTDGTSTDSSTLAITVTPVDDAYTDANETVTIAEDASAAGNVLTGTSSVDGAVTVTGFSIAGDPTVHAAGATATIAGVGSLTLNADGGYSFTPNANYNGNVPLITYTSTDGSSDDSSTLAINVTPADDASVVAPDTNTVAEDTVATGNVLGNDSDIDNTLSVSSFTVAGVAGSFAAGTTAAIAGVGSLILNGDGSYSFTPVANYNGTVPVATYTLNTGSSSTLSITVTPVDDASIVAPDTNTIAEDTIASGNVLGNDSDVDNSLSVTSFTVAGVAGSFAAGATATIAGVGSLVLNGNGSYTFTPVADWNGSVPQVSYTLNTGSGSTLDITVTPVSDTYTDADEVVTITEDSTASGNVLTGTSSPDGVVGVTSFTVAGVPGSFAAGASVAIPGVGNLTLNADGSYSFAPNANYNGTVPTISYTTSDGVSTDGSTLSITVTPVDDSYTDANETVTINEDSTAAGSVLTGTSSVDGAVTVTTFTVAGNATVFNAGQTATIAGVGALQINADGSYTFTPNANYNGTVPLVTYNTTDGSSGDSSTLAITVTPVDDAYTDANETVTINEDSTAAGSVLTGTSSVDGAVTVTTFTVAGNATVFNAGQTATIAGVGSLQINADGSYTFTPNANYNGTVPLVTYNTTDGSSGDSSTLAISVTPVDDAYTDANETVTINEDSTAAGSVLTGTSSVDGSVTVTTFTVAGNATVFNAGQTATIAGVGAIQINSDGSYTFTPNANYNGTVPLVTYNTTDGSSGDTSTLAISVTPVDDAYADANETVTINEDSTAADSVLTGTSSVDGAVTVTTFTVAGNATIFNAGQTATIAGVGALQINADGSYTFTPNANYNGTVPLVSYNTTDGSSGDASTLAITVTPVDDAYTDANETVTINEDSTAAGSVLSGTSSVDGAVTVTTFTVAGNATVFNAGQTATIAGVGALQINADGSYTFTPNANYNGTVPLVSYNTTDGSSDDSSTLSITVTPVDDAYTDANETVTINEDSTAAGSVLTGTSSVDGAVTVTTFTVAGNATVFNAGQTATIAGVGSLQINTDGSYTFTPNANYNGTVPLVTYNTTDGSSADSSTLAISVTPVDDAYTDANETVTINEDSTAAGSVLTGTSSVDGSVTVTTFTVAGNATVFNAGQTATIAGVGALQINADGSYTFTPNANYNGTVPLVTYNTTDGSSGDSSTLAITVTPVDDAYTDANETVTINEDSTAAGSVLTGTSSVDGAVTVTTFTVAGNATVFNAGQTANIAGVGTLQINSDGSYTFTPNANYNGTVPLVTYSTTDGSSGDTSTLAITVNPVDDAYTDANETVTINEDSTAAGSVLTGTSSVDGAVTVTTFTVAGNATVFNAGQTATIVGVGALQINADGSYTFTPNANYNGTVPLVTYNTTDGSSGDTSTLAISVTPVDDAYTDANETVTINEDSTAAGSVLSGTASVDGAVTVTTYTVAGNATVFNAGQTATIAGVGALQINADGSYIFTPNANYNGTVPLVTYNTTDGSSGDSSTLAITVNPVDDASVVVADTNTIVEDTVATGNVLTNDSDIDSTLSVATFTVTGVAGTFNAGSSASIAGVGTLVINSNGSYTFTPVANYNGTVPVASYVLNTGSSSTLSITVTPVDDASVVAPDTNTIAEDTVATGNVLTNDSDIDNTLTVSTFTVAGVAGTFNAGSTATIAGVGALVINSNGSYTFTPVANYNGTVPVANYVLNTGSGSTLAITVTPVDDAFIDANEAVSVNEDTTLNGNVLSGTSSVDGPVTVTTFTVAGVAGTFNAGQTSTISGVGTLVINSNGTYTFAPVANYNGTVPVATYTMTDGSSGDTSTLAITVNPVDDAFVDANESISGNEDTTLNGNVLSGTTSVDGPVTVTTFTVAGVAGTFNAGQTATITGVGTLQINANGTYTFTPVANWNGTVPVATYTMTDGSSGDTSTLAITVNPVDDAYTDANETVSVNEDAVLAGNVLTGTTSVDGPVTVTTYTVAGVAGTFNAGQTVNISGVGSLLINANGSFTFTPAANYSGSVPVATYTTTDGSSGDTSTLSLSVTAVADAPAVAASNVSGTEGQWIALNLSAALTDLDGSESLSGRSLNGIPVGATISDGTNTFTATAGNTSLNLAGWNLSSLEFQGSATGNGQTYTLTLAATSTEASNGSNASSASSFTVTVADTSPVAVADSDSVGVGATSTGNVVSGAGGNAADTLGHDAAQLSNVNFNGTPVSSSYSGGVWTIVTSNGTLTINQSGAYSYVSSHANKSVSGGTSAAAWDNVDIDYYGFDRESGTGDQTPFSGASASSGLSMGKLTASAAGLITFVDNNPGSSDDGMGVERGSQSNNSNNRLESGEYIVLDLNMNTSAIAVTLNGLDGSSDAATWYAYGESGNYLGTGTITGNNSGVVTANISNMPGAHYLVLAYDDDSFRIGGVVAQPDLSAVTPDVFNYTLTDSDGDTSATTLTVSTDTMIGTAADVGTVYESGLTNGTLAGTTPTVFSGNLLDNDTGIAGNIEISNVGGQTPSGGVITISNSVGTLTVYTTDDGTHRVGDYTYTLNGATTQGSNDAQSFSYSVRNPVSGQTASSSLTINVVDDAPIGSNVVETLQAAETLPTYNLVLTIDISGSMAEMVGNTGKTRLQVAKEALAEMIEKFDQVGNVNIQVVAFDDTASESPWFNDSPAAALAYINSLEPDGGTRYSTALTAVMNGFTQPAADKTIFYFISDGEPTSGYAVNSSQQTLWENFVAANGDIAFGIGIGDASLTYLNPVAYPNGSGEPYAIKVDDPEDLADTLLSTIDQGIVIGEVSVLSGSGENGFLLGADGGHLQSVTIDGVTYTYDAANPNVTVVTAKGGELTVNFETGEYHYQLIVNTTIQGQQEVFPISAVDADGDSKTINLVINLDYIANLDASRDIILTNVADGSALNISTEALMHNDFKAGTTTFNGVGNAQGGTVSASGGTVTFDPTAALATSSSGFGNAYTAINENTFNGGVFAGDSSGNAKNNTVATAMDLTNRALFGPVTGTAAADLADPERPSVKVTGTLTASNGNQDSDYIKVYLKAGETIYLDIDRGIDAGGNSTSVDSRLYLYDAANNEMAANSTSAGLDAGSTSTNDPYLTYTVGVEGEYYVRVRHQSNASSSDAGGDYDLWISIDPQVLPSTTPVGFDYTLTDAGENDTAGASVYGISGSTITGGSVDEILYGSGNADVLIGNAGDDVLLGNAGADTLRGGSGADRLEGGAGNDTLDGGSGKDILIGGSGNDVLSGGLGADMFVWDLADKGTAGTPAVDTITDFDLAASSDKLDLRDMLVGEYNGGLNANLENFLHFEKSGSNTILHISSNGGFSSDTHSVGGSHSSGSEDQTIVLQGVDLIGSFTTDQQVIQDLLNKGKLQTD